MKYLLFACSLTFLFTTCGEEKFLPREKALGKIVQKVEKKSPEKATAPIYASYDYGASWEPVEGGFSDSVGIGRIGKIGDQIIVSTFNAGLFLENKSGQKWHQIGEELPQKQVNALHIADESIFVGMYRNGIYKSDDKGQSWQSMNYDLPDLRVQSILKTKHQLFAGTDSGIFEYSVAEKKWTHRFEDVQVNALATYEDKIMAATNKGILLSNSEGKDWEWIHQEGAVFNATILEGGTLMISQQGDLFRSKDWGKTWEELFYFPKDNFGVLETVELGQYLIMSHRNGIFRSSDGGNLWFQMLQPFDLPFSELFVDDKVIYASGASGC
ncbi:MAG: hypothetical protein AAF849_21575 [Bacteroidota bacterium]